MLGFELVKFDDLAKHWLDGDLFGVDCWVQGFVFLVSDSAFVSWGPCLERMWVSVSEYFFSRQLVSEDSVKQQLNGDNQVM